MLPPDLFENALLLAHFATLPNATDQTNPEVQDAVDNETVDDYACSERAPASKSVKADNFNEVLLVPEQMLMVEKGMYRVIMHGSSKKWHFQSLHVTCSLHIESHLPDARQCCSGCQGHGLTRFLGLTITFYC